MFSVAPTRVTAEDGGNKNEEIFLSSNNSGGVDEVNDYSIDKLSKFVLSCLHSGRTSNHSLARTSFLVPDGLAQYIAREIKASSDIEPYGIRGCTLCLGFQDRKAQTCVRLGKFPLDPSFVSTFEITLCFKEDFLRNIWSVRTLRMLMPLLDELLRRRESKVSSNISSWSSNNDSSSSISSGSSSDTSNNNSSSSSSLVISKDVDILKKKLYRSSR